MLSEGSLMAGVKIGTRSSIKSVTTIFASLLPDQLDFLTFAMAGVLVRLTLIPRMSFFGWENTNFAQRPCTLSKLTNQKMSRICRLRSRKCNSAGLGLTVGRCDGSFAKLRFTKSQSSGENVDGRVGEGDFTISSNLSQNRLETR